MRLKVTIDGIVMMDVANLNQSMINREVTLWSELLHEAEFEGDCQIVIKVTREI